MQEVKAFLTPSDSIKNGDTNKGNIQAFEILQQAYLVSRETLKSL
jgi:hypothetical protein